MAYKSIDYSLLLNSGAELQTIINVLLINYISYRHSRSNSSIADSSLFDVLRCANIPEQHIRDGIIHFLDNYTTRKHDRFAKIRLLGSTTSLSCDVPKTTEVKKEYPKKQANSTIVLNAPDAFDISSAVKQTQTVEIKKEDEPLPPNPFNMSMVEAFEFLNIPKRCKFLIRMDGSAQVYAKLPDGSEQDLHIRARNYINRMGLKGQEINL